MIQFSGKKVYDFFLTWCMGLIFLFSSYVFMEDVLYRKFLGLNFDNGLLAVLMCISALFFGATMSYAGVYVYDFMVKLRAKRKKTTPEVLGDISETVDLNIEDMGNKQKKQWKKLKHEIYRASMFFGTSFSCLVIFLVKLVIEIRFYNYSNIQYTLMFLAFTVIFLKELDRLKARVELVRNTCMNKMSDI